VPEISRFFGIRILMYYADHAPPHFHAEYAGERVAMEIATLAVLHGQLPGRALGLVVEWARSHGAELDANWELARQARPLRLIEPLK
jgi:hypothetical protein